MNDSAPEFLSGSIPLLGPDDPPATIVTNPGGSSPFLLLGDHAGRAIPRRLGNLGLSPEAMDLHIAWDIGVAGLGARLAQRLDACFVHQRYSRLVIDCNRRLESPDLIPEQSDGVVVPGNLGLQPAQIEARQTSIWRAYHERIAAALDERQAQGRATAIISLHSFTPHMNGMARPWHFGVLHRQDSVLSARVLADLQAALGAQAGDNQPYAMDQTDNTVPLHADARGLDYLELEVRQDLIAASDGQTLAANFIAELLGG